MIVMEIDDRGNQARATDLLHRVVLRAARVARGQDYQIDSMLTGSSLVEVARLRLWALLRGALLSIRVRRAALPLFVGRSTAVRHAHLLELGGGVSIGDYAIVDALSRAGIRVGARTTIAEFAYLKCTGTLGNLGVGIVIGDNSAIGAYSYIGAAGGVTIGSNVLFGQRVSVHAENHIFDRCDLPIRAQGVSREGVRIEDDCWIGSHSVILDGVTIGRGSIVAAGSVVTHDIAAGMVVAGVPAKVVRHRGEKPGIPYG
jgi:acetyltransferase-like isoleucine patch superfamily enzyme